MFHISELLGVSAWVYFADATPAKKAEIIFDKSVEMVSKEGYDTVLCPAAAMAVMIPLMWLFGGFA